MIAGHDTNIDIAKINRHTACEGLNADRELGCREENEVCSSQIILHPLLRFPLRRRLHHSHYPPPQVRPHPAD